MRRYAIRQGSTIIVTNEGPGMIPAGDQVILSFEVPRPRYIDAEEGRLVYPAGPLTLRYRLGWRRREAVLPAGWLIAEKHLS
jgi:hypothetical protein